MEFPRLVYRSANEHKLVEGGDEFNIARKEGWFASVPEAIAHKHDVADEVDVDEDAPPTRDELELKALELKIKFTKKTTDAELGELIAKALE